MSVRQLCKLPALQQQQQHWKQREAKRLQAKVWLIEKVANICRNIMQASTLFFRLPQENRNINNMKMRRKTLEKINKSEQENERVCTQCELCCCLVPSPSPSPPLDARFEYLYFAFIVRRENKANPEGCGGWHKVKGIASVRVVAAEIERCRRHARGVLAHSASWARWLIASVRWAQQGGGALQGGRRWAASCSSM